MHEKESAAIFDVFFPVFPAVVKITDMYYIMMHM